MSLKSENWDQDNFESAEARWIGLLYLVKEVYTRNARSRKNSNELGDDMATCNFHIFFSLLLLMVIVLTLLPVWLAPNLNFVKVESEFVWDQFRQLRENLDLLKDGLEGPNETEDLMFCDEDGEGQALASEEKIFSNRNLFDALTRKLEDEVLKIMTSTSPCSTRSSPTSSTSSTRPTETLKILRNKVEHKDQQLGLNKDQEVEKELALRQQTIVIDIIVIFIIIIKIVVDIIVIFIINIEVEIEKDICQQRKPRCRPRQRPEARSFDRRPLIYNR